MFVVVLREVAGKAPLPVIEQDRPVPVEDRDPDRKGAVYVQRDPVVFSPVQQEHDRRQYPGQQDSEDDRAGENFAG